MNSLYARFLSHLSEGSSILDAGCGAGRDSLYFLNTGYKVTAFDGSKEMAKHSSSLTGLNVSHLRFDELDFDQKFDGIWACASILHVEKAQMTSVLNKLTKTTKDRGILYMSFKYGAGEDERGGRHFSNYTEDTFRELLKTCPSLHLLDTWITNDVRPSRNHELWLNILLEKQL
jgi:cyclopropane fatty-acyl-phospholipid synthase-like methyltransferase